MSRDRSRHHERDRERSRSPQPKAASIEENSSEKERERRRRRESGGEEERRWRGRRDEGGMRERGEEERRHGGREERREGKHEHREGGEEERGRKREEGEERRRREGEETRRWKEERRGEGRVRAEGHGDRRHREERGRERRGPEEAENETQAENSDRPGETDGLETRRDEGRRQRREQRIREDEEAKDYKFGGGGDKKEGEPEEMEEPDFALSGKLTAETNTYKGVVIKYSEPAEARQPTTRWRLYQFKGDEVLPTLYVHRQSAYLIGRDRRVVDVPVDHPSCSGQHAVLQYRLVTYEKQDGSVGKRVRPYLIDLESTNGTYINSQRIESARYWELKEQDMIKFGFSSREYIMLHENSKNAANSPEDQP